MTKVLPLSRWKKESPWVGSLQRWGLGWRRFWIRRNFDPKEEGCEAKAWSKRNRKFEEHRTKPNPPYLHTKEISAASNAKQSSAKKTVSGIDEAARTAFWPTSKAIQTEPIEALILPFSKIIREGPTVYYCDHVTNVTYKIQYKYPDISFLRRLVENQNWKSPWRKSFLRSKKATRDLNSQ